MKHTFRFLVVLFLLISSTSLASGKFKKVVWIVFENANYDEALNQPDFAKLTQEGVLFTNMFAESHPSQPNYISMIAGSALGVGGDSPANLDGHHIGDLLEKAGLDWGMYLENYPGNCFQGNTKNYVRKHNPFMSFTNVTNNPSRCQKLKSEASFVQDFSTGNLPQFSMYIPNLKNDGHDTNVDYAGRWLSSKLGTVLATPGDTLFIVTFDESELFNSANQIYTVLIGRNIAAGTKSSQKLNHVALLKMIEDEFGVGNLNHDDATAPAITGIWK